MFTYFLVVVFSLFASYFFVYILISFFSLSIQVFSLLIRDVAEKRGLSEPLMLPDSDHYDCVMCGCTIDLDFDGENEILIGTYGQVMV